MYPLNYLRGHDWGVGIFFFSITVFLEQVKTEREKSHLGSNLDCHKNTFEDVLVWPLLCFYFLVGRGGCAQGLTLALHSIFPSDGVWGIICGAEG